MGDLSSQGLEIRNERRFQYSPIDLFLRIVATSLKAAMRTTRQLIPALTKNDL